MDVKMTVFSNFTNEQLIKEFEYYWQKDYKPKGLFEEVAKRLLEQQKKDELLDLYRLQHEFQERYNTSNRLLDRQECLNHLHEVAKEIYLKEKELEELQ